MSRKSQRQRPTSSGSSPRAEVPFIEAVPGGVRLKVRVQPRSSKNAAEGASGGVLKVRLTAPPVDGEANAALIEFLSKITGTRKSSVKIISGERSREKTVFIEGATAQEAGKALGV